MYTEVILDDVFKSFEIANGGNFQNLSRINVLIGKNNSGKSRFMRTLFAHQKLEFKTENSAALNYSYQAFRGVVEKLHNTWEYGNLSDVVHDLRNIKLPKRENDKAALEAILRSFDQVDERINKDNYQIQTAFRGYFKGEMRALVEAIHHRKDEQYKGIYIPILRGLRPVQLEKEGFSTSVDTYHKRTIKDYFADDSKTPLPYKLEDQIIVSGLGLYEETRKLLLGSLRDRKKVRSFEKFIGDTFFEGKEFSIVPREGDDVLHVRIGPEEKDEKRISDLGDGIQSVIALTYPLFFHKDESCTFFFEEPETHLHPGLQRLFIETLRHPDFKNFQYFLTTHSNHFLDLTADYDDIAVYSFKKKEDTENEVFIIEDVEDGKGSILQEIGVRASSVFLSNCTIWVEGITDRLYIRKFLEVFQKAKRGNIFKEDYHYSFVEYGGNNITHWSFLDPADEGYRNINVDWISRRVFLITDEDEAKEGSMKRERQKFLQEKLGSNYLCLPCLEIENILTADIIKKAISKREKKDDLDFSKFDSAKTGYKNRKLGAFIDANKIGIERTYAYSKRNGTIKEKLPFCKNAVESIETIDDLSADALDLCEKLYRFIAESNAKYVHTAHVQTKNASPHEEAFSFKREIKLTALPSPSSAPPSLPAPA